MSVQTIRDAWLVTALEELQGASPPDLAEQILESWRQESGALERQELRSPNWMDPPSPCLHTASGGRGRRRLTLAAQWLLVACAVAVVGLLWMASDRDEAPPPEPDRQPIGQDPKQDRPRKNEAQKRAQKRAQERARERARKQAQKQARRLVTFLELDSRRVEATNELLKLGRDAVPALVMALDDPRPEVVQRVCHILRALGSQAAAAKAGLVAASRSKDPAIAHAARHALARVVLPGGITLVADWSSHRVMELDRSGKVLRVLTQVKAPSCVERLSNGNYLICATGAGEVVEMTAKGRVVWRHGKLKHPHKAQRLFNGNTLIVNFGGPVLEVDRAGKTVWTYKGRLQPVDVERLPTGNTLIVDALKKRVLEVTRKGEVVWEHKPGQTVHDADRLPNGNTLITMAARGQVLEITPSHRVVWKLEGLNRPNDADRLPNGHTLIAQLGEVAEYDAKGKKVWSVKMSMPVEVTRY